MALGLFGISPSKKAVLKYNKGLKEGK